MRRQPKDTVSGHNLLTDEEAGELAEYYTYQLGDDPDAIGRLLLLCSSLTHERDHTAREGMMIAIENKLAPFTRDHDRMLERELRRQLDALRKGGK